MSEVSIEELLIARIAARLAEFRHVAVGVSSPIPGAAALLAREQSKGRLRVSILGSRKHMGVLAMGTSLPAVDATVCRLMGIAPERISYLKLAANRLGPIADRFVRQQGERWETLASPFQILDRPRLQGLRVERGELVS